MIEGSPRGIFNDPALWTVVLQSWGYKLPGLLAIDEKSNVRA